MTESLGTLTLDSAKEGTIQQKEGWIAVCQVDRKIEGGARKDLPERGNSSYKGISV